MQGIGMRMVGVVTMPITVAMGCVLAGCPGSMPVTGDDAPTGQSLFTLITDTDPYQQWAQFPSAQGVIESAAPHGPMAQVFINSVVQEAMGDFTGELPAGAVIVKENLGESSSDKAESLTIMWKVEGFDPDNHNWFWTNVSPQGEVRAEGRVDDCMNCHSGARDNDFVFLHQF